MYSCRYGSDGVGGAISGRNMFYFRSSIYTLGMQTQMFRTLESFATEKHKMVASICAFIVWLVVYVVSHDSFVFIYVTVYKLLVAL